MRQNTNAEVEIIRLLKGGPEYVSGEALSKGLGISRTAVWKHIKGLRKLGYSIEACPSKGYRLKDSPENFNSVSIQTALSTQTIGHPLYFFDKIDSTNLKAFELGREGEPEGTAIVADAQMSGKGRIGRKWESPAGANIYTSIILRPPIPPQHAQKLTFLLAVAVAQAVEGFSRIRPEVKWPNDILVNKKKLAGILLEMDSEVDKVNFVVAGIGLNVNMDEAIMGGDIRHLATSICLCTGERASRARLLGALYSSIEKWYKIYLKDGSAPVMKAWKEYFGAEGKPVAVKGFNSTITGICAGVDEDGALLIRTEAGKLERVLSGDMEAIDKRALC